MAPTRSRARVFAISAVTTLILAATAYGVGVAVANSTSAGPELGPRIARPADQASDDDTGVSTGSTDDGLPTHDGVSTGSTDDGMPTDDESLPRIVLRPGDKGEQVRELQQRLFQLEWLPEVTTGVYDADTKEAVQGFQVRRHLKGTGVLDRHTWQRLKAMTKTPTHDAMFNVLHPGPAILQAGDSGDDVRDAQARLKQIAWIYGDVTGTYDKGTVEAVLGFQAKRQIPVTGKIDQRTLDRLHAMTVTPSHEELFNIEPKPGALDPRCRTGRVLCIDKTSRTLRWVIDGKVQLTMDARFGSTVNDTPTREGLFHVYFMNADHVSKLYGSSMPYAMFFSGGQAVHYSPDFAANGYAGASHGCVNVRDYGAIASLFDQVPIGTRVVIYWS
jgi:peptidoglycan hydrolase-like protein with peptidoglycan-binding domain